MTDERIKAVFEKYEQFVTGKEYALIRAIAEAVAAQQEPVAYIRVSKTGHVMACAKTGDFYSLPHKTLLYTTPPQRTWVGLTEQDLDYLCNLAYTGDEEFALAVQAKLMEKNA